jgi:2-methylcitrate dehydratase PrpD
LVCEPLAAKQAPRSIYEARFSLPFSLALAVVDGALSLDSYDADRLSDSSVLEVARRVDYEILEYEEFPDAFPGGVRLEMEDGSRFEEHVRYNIGSVGNPMSEEDICAKFMGGARRLMSAADSERMLASLRGLETSASLVDFTQAMANAKADLTAESV